MTYIIDCRKGEKCHFCGDDAVMMYVSEEIDPETGYVDEIALCNECFEKEAGEFQSERTPE